MKSGRRAITVYPGGTLIRKNRRSSGVGREARTLDEDLDAFERLVVVASRTTPVIYPSAPRHWGRAR